MSYEKRLKAEINSKIDDMMACGQALRAEFIAHAICNDHMAGLADNEDADFWRHAGYRMCREYVTRCINKRAGDKIERQVLEPTLPGYEHVHRYYTVSRDGDEVAVSVYDMTDDELEGKAALYRSFGAANYAHADELDRFKRERSAQESSVV